MTLALVDIPASGQTIVGLMEAVTDALKEGTPRGDIRILTGRLAEPLFTYDDGEAKELWELTPGALFIGVLVV